MKRALTGDSLKPTDFGHLKVFSGSAHTDLANEIVEFLGVPSEVVEEDKKVDTQ